MNTSSLIRSAGPLGLYALARQLTRHHPRILMYHRFSAEPRKGFVSAAAFDDQVAHIARYYKPVALGTLIGWLRAGEPIPAHTIVITVDDGYADFHDVAFPILRKHQVPATLFVTTGFIDGALWLWPDQVRWVLDTARRRPDTLTVAGNCISIHTAPWQQIIDALLRIPDTDKHHAIQGLAETLGTTIPESPPAAFAPLNWQQLREMQAAGIEFGGHTHTHPTLPKVEPSALTSEIDHCLHRLNAELGPRPRPFCYPNGQPEDYSSIVRDAVEQAGFTGAVVAYADAQPQGDLYALRRHSGSCNRFQFQKAVSGLEWLGRRAKQRGTAA